MEEIVFVLFFVFECGFEVVVVVECVKWIGEVELDGVVVVGGGEGLELVFVFDGVGGVVGG